ncbi:MmgE/PrpD family protein [Mesorhizobium sp. M1312]|uniref:MmgE/PrpD family protein n=1 Tax=unclassified Mesorhizobium TaxID=325217 RepID=UPI0033393A33
MTIVGDFAQFLSGIGDIEPEPIEKAKAAVLDLVTAAVAGADAEGTIAAHKAASAVWKEGDAAVWFSDRRMSAPGAAFVNSTSASILDMDDGHRAAAGHPGASIIPAVLATAATHRCAPERILTAIVLGYEIAVRVGSSRDFASLTTLVSGPWVGYGAAAAAAWLRGLDTQAIEQAIAIAGTTAPNLSAIAYSKVMGNHIKEGIPWATATALVAVELAAAGSTGPVDLLDNESLFNRNQLVDGLGSNWAINGIYFKPYGCCRWAHSAIDAVLWLQSQHGIAAQNIETIEIDTFSWALRLNNEVAPRTVESAQYSVPFCVAMALTKGAGALVEVEPPQIADPETLALARDVRLRVDPSFDAMFPQSVPARVRITTRDSSMVREVAAPLGEPTNPMDWTALQTKFRTVADRRLDEHCRDRFLTAFEDMKQGRLESLLAALEMPLVRGSRQAKDA